MLESRGGLGSIPFRTLPKVRPALEAHGRIRRFVTRFWHSTWHSTGRHGLAFDGTQRTMERHLTCDNVTCQHQKNIL
jgi:hypothetical protein